MKSLFLKFFLSFWLAIALFVLLAILVVMVFRPQRNPTWESLRSTALADAISAFEHGGEPKVREYLDNLDATQHVHAHVFDEQGKEISGRPAPAWVQHLAMGMSHPPHQGLLSPAPRVLAESRASSDGHHRFTIALVLPPGPRVFFGPHGFPVTGLLILVISSGLVCFFLAWYLTKPVIRLRAATRQLAAGDLSARTGAPASRRRDEISGLLRDFDAMAERLETLVNAQSRLLKDISHELRSPLSRLDVALGVGRERTAPEGQSILDGISLESNRMNELIGSLTTIARLDSGAGSIRKQPVHLEDLVQE